MQGPAGTGESSNAAEGAEGSRAGGRTASFSFVRSKALNSIAKAEIGGIAAPGLKRSERGAEAFARAARHSRRVRVLKIVLPAAAVVVSVLFLGYSLLSPTVLDGLNLESATIEGGSLVMHNPSLNGFTSENLPYSVTATRARQEIGSDSGPIELEKIQATLPIDAERQATVTAGGGVFDQEKNRLLLNNAITVESNAGIFAQLKSANVDMASGNLSTDEPVDIEVNGMRVRAKSFHTIDGLERLVFENGVRLEIDPASVRRAQEEGTAGDG